MDTIAQVKRIYKEANAVEPPRKRKSESGFLSHFKVRVVAYINEYKFSKPVDYEKLDKRLNTIALYCKKHKMKPVEFIQLVADLVEDVIINRNSSMYKKDNPNQKDLF